MGDAIRIRERDSREVFPIGRNGIADADTSNHVFKPTAESKLWRRVSGLKVLMYHRITEERELAERSEFCVHKEEFCKQLELLMQHGYTPITFNDYELYNRGEIQLPQKPVILTFDDGYLDTFHIAYPLLLEFGMRAVIFVLGNRDHKTNHWDEHHPDIPVAFLMEESHITELHNRDFEIGAHSMNHVNLAMVSEREAYKEISMGKERLEDLLGTSVNSFSYPYGSVNPVVKSLVAQSGFDFACSVFTGPPKTGDDRFEIRRMTIHGKMGLSEFLLRLKTPIEYLDWFRWKFSRNENGRRAGQRDFCTPQSDQKE